MHAFEQQDDGPLQLDPLPAQPENPVMDAQLPLSQRFEQQSALVLHAPVPESHNVPPSAFRPFTSAMSSDPHANATMAAKSAKRRTHRFLMPTPK